MDVTCHIKLDDLTLYLQNVFGSGYIIENVKKLDGGAQKVVYKIESRNGCSCILYVWDISMNYILQENQCKALLSGQSYGAEFFELNNRYLCEIGVRTPALYYINKDRQQYPFDFALVEYISGRDASTFFNLDSTVRDKVFIRLGEMLETMHANQRKTYGKINSIEKNADECHELIMENAVMQLSYVSQHMPSIASNQDKLLELLGKLQSNIMPRQRYGLIHGELGPDHVLVNDNLEPYLIDIEGVEFFDIEHEHSFLQFRFGEFYRYLENHDLDHDRMLFYRLHHHISVTSGGLKLLLGGFPNKQFAKEIIEHNSRAVMRFLD